jgi:hypothetical protein
LLKPSARKAMNNESDEESANYEAVEEKLEKLKVVG